MLHSSAASLMSQAEIVARMPHSERLRWYSEHGVGLGGFLHNWRFWARPNQIAPPGEWLVWLALAGRGFGKTETGANWIIERVEQGARSIAIIAETQKDLEEVVVARILKVSKPDNMPTVRYKPVRITWPNGAVALGYNATEPDQLRGPEFDTAWVDELAKFRYAQEVWDMLQFTMRLGDNPRIFISTTPRPIPLIKELVTKAKKLKVVITRGSTAENRANLAPTFIDTVEGKYKGTRLGRQELNGEIVDDFPGALWTRANLDANRVFEIPDMTRIVVAIDPSGTRGATALQRAKKEQADDVGIVAAGKGVDGHAYVLKDTTCNLSPIGWGNRAINTYKMLEADCIIAEVNFGGAMVESVIRSIDPDVPYKEVRASRGKVARAEPVAALYAQGRVHHYGHELALLEDQMCMFATDGYMGEGSPDRTDAAVWAITELMLEEEKKVHAAVYMNRKRRS